MSAWVFPTPVPLSGPGGCRHLGEVTIANNTSHTITCVSCGDRVTTLGQCGLCGAFYDKRYAPPCDCPKPEKVLRRCRSCGSGVSLFYPICPMCNGHTAVTNALIAREREKWGAGSR